MVSFKNLLQNHWAKFNQTQHKSSSGKRIQVHSNEGDSPSPKISLKNFKNLLQNQQAKINQT
jgi:hypothetical protein